jgi:hypothetical protein
MKLLAWSIACLAGACVGVLAGVHPHNPAGALLAISVVVALATGALSRILSRSADQV